MVTLWLLLACTPEAPPEPVAPVELAEVDPDAPPPGKVGGAPILDRPVILGGIDNGAVETAFDPSTIRACNTAGRPGKVLLKFRIDKGGRVVSVETKSSTLRHEPSEACLHAAVKATTFPELERGASAMVTWPFEL